MRHLDVAGGTGDVAFRVLKAIRAAEAEANEASTSAPRVLPRALGDNNHEMYVQQCLGAGLGL